MTETTQLHDLVGVDRHPQRKRVGRGDASGKGSMSGRGSKGQKARTGGSIPARFEGGQTPLFRRIAKNKGFRHHRKWSILKINLKDLPRYVDADGKLTLAGLATAGKVSAKTQVKILGEGEVKSVYQVQVHLISGRAADKIKAAGGTVEII
ncbi:MAG: 50S ribosomal protein L15 [bacterium]